jgi:CRISPR/Cas system-associated endonuclease Cas1
MLTKNESLSVDKSSGLLETKTLKKLSDALLERHGTAVAYQGEKVLLKHVIKYQVRKLCKHLKGEITYRHFTGYY